MIGTPDYISTEQAAGQPADHRADIYALGVMLYEMSRGRLPFKGDTALSVITKHRENVAENPREINPEISIGLSGLILRCMEKDKENRYQTARELLEDLLSLSKGEQLKKTYRKKKDKRFQSWKGIGLVTAAALVLSVAIVILWKIQGTSPSTLSEPERPSLGVVYFENNTGDESLAHWRKAFAELLTADLSQSKYLKVLPGDQMYKILGDLDQLEASTYSSDILKQVAQKGKVRHILRGSYIKAGSTFRVSITLQDMETGEQVGSQTAEAQGEENLFALVDDMTKRIKSDMRLTSEQIETDIDGDAAEVMTSSPEAFRLFVEGLRHHYRAEYHLCLDLMDKAIAIDPEFTAAYGWKAFSYDSLGDHEEFVTAMTKAYELRHRVTARERFKIVAYYYMRVAGDIPKAMEELQNAVRLYPEDIFATHMLGYLYFHAFEDYENAVKYLRNNIENRIKMFYSYYIMAWTQMCLGNYEEAQDVCELYISEHGDHPEIVFSLSINYFCRGDYDRALIEAEKTEELGFSADFWNGLIKGGIQQANGDITGAEVTYQNMGDSRNILVGIIGRECLGVLALLRGRYGEAKSQIEQAIDLAEAAKNEANMSRMYTHLGYIGLQTRNYKASLEACEKAIEYGKYSMDTFKAIKLALHVKGLCQLRMGNSDAAVKTADEMKAASEKDPSRRTMRDYLNLVGNIEMVGGNTSDAIIHFEEAASLLPAQNQEDLAGFKHSLRRTVYLFSLAEAYFRAGNMDRAEQSCERLTGLTIGRHHWGDLYVKAFYMLGQICEKQGKTKEAISHYQKFLELWNDADPNIPELSDARTRLDLLSN
jgi:tetratricopeptide (TPR) repeat protein